MERATLTRDLRPLTRAKWVVAATGKDRRQHVLQLTVAGKRKLVRSLPLWEEAQRQFLSQIGSEPLQELRALLTSAESAVTKAFTADQEEPLPAPLRARMEPTYASRSH
jgi:DNA-binding MarR family transcriptional regulator